MRLEARIAGKKERKMGWSTKATLVLFGLVVALLVASYAGSCSTSQPENSDGAFKTVPAKPASMVSLT